MTNEILETLRGQQKPTKACSVCDLLGLLDAETRANIEECFDATDVEMTKLHRWALANLQHPQPNTVRPWQRHRVECRPKTP